MESQLLFPIRFSSISENLKILAECLDRGIDELVVVVMKRDRHIGLIKEIRDAGARVKLIADGDVGAAIACPERKVITLEGDGSAMYTLQSLWTMARENLDVTVVIFANRAYKILLGELTNVGAAAAGHNATAMLTLDNPALDWVSLAKGFGVAAGRATTLDELAVQFKRGLAMPGPYLIELMM